MATDIYRSLACHLDNLPGGFPSTANGVELRILRRLFTPEETELALHLSLIPEAARVIARRAGINREDAVRRLEEMARKGLIISIPSEAKPVLYMAAQFVVGIWEFHVNDLDPDLVRDVDEYLPTLFREAWKKPQLRTIPVGRSLSPRLTVLPYERAEELVRDVKKATVAPCICRRERRIGGDGCTKPEESCLAFGIAADHYLRNGLGRSIDRVEALDILARADEAGLVLQPGNSRESVFICCCCGCCCGVLRTVKLYPKPATLVSSPFAASADEDSCNGCGTCLQRCQMDALRLESEKVVLDRDRCIGCGLCVSTCPTGSLTLMRKPEPEQPRVPRNMVEASVQLGRARGKLGLSDLALMQVKSKFDRLLASIAGK